MTETANPGATGMNVDPTTLLGGGGSIGRQLLVTAIAILLGLLVGAVLIILSGVIGPAHTLDLTLPITAYGALLEGALGGPKAIANTLNAATPLIFAGLSVAFGFRAGLFNIGANGQFLIGAFCAAIVGHAIGLPFPIALALAIFAGALGVPRGASSPAPSRRGAAPTKWSPRSCSTASPTCCSNLLASSIFKDPTATFPRTPDISPGAVLPIILADTRLHGGIILAVLTAFVVWFVLFKTTLGFEIRTVGANASAARYAGIRPAVHHRPHDEHRRRARRHGRQRRDPGQHEELPGGVPRQLRLRWDRRRAPRSGASVRASSARPCSSGSCARVPVRCSARPRSRSTSSASSRA